MSTWMMRLVTAIRACQTISDAFWLPMHPGGRRCSSLTSAGYARSSRLAGRAPRHPECTTYCLTGPNCYHAFHELDSEAADPSGERAGDSRRPVRYFRAAWREHARAGARSLEAGTAPEQHQTAHVRRPERGGVLFGRR